MSLCLRSLILALTLSLKQGAAFDFFCFLFFYLSLLSYNLRIGETTQLPQGHNTLETFERNSIVNVQHFLNLNSSLGQGLSS